MVTEKTFGAIAGLLFEGGVGLGESACGGHGLGEMDQKYITPGDSVGLSESRLESRDTRGREAHQSSDKMPVRGRDRDNQIKVTGRGTSLSDILYSFSRERPPAQTPTHDAPQPASTGCLLNRLSFQLPTLLCLAGPSPSPAPSMRSSLHLVVAAVPALAATKDVFWDITYVDNVNPDGLFERRAIGVNGTWP